MEESTCPHSTSLPKMVVASLLGIDFHIIWGSDGEYSPRDLRCIRIIVSQSGGKPLMVIRNVIPGLCVLEKM